MEENTKNYLNRLNAARILALLLAIPIVNSIVNLLGIASCALLVISIILLKELKQIETPKPTDMKAALIVSIVGSSLSCAQLLVGIMRIVIGNETLRAMQLSLLGLTIMSSFPGWVCMIVAAILLHGQYQAMINMAYEKINKNDFPVEQEKPADTRYADIVEAAYAETLPQERRTSASQDLPAAAEFVDSNELKTVRVMLAISIALNVFIFLAGIAYISLAKFPDWLAWLCLAYVLFHIALIIIIVSDKCLPKLSLLALLPVALGSLAVPFIKLLAGAQEPIFKAFLFILVFFLLIPCLLYMLIYAVIQVISLINFKKNYIRKQEMMQKQMYLKKHL